MAPVLPSGEQIVLTHGRQRAVVTEVGAGLRSYAIGEHDVIDGFGQDEPATAGRGQALLPWPNRVRDGRYTFAQAEQQQK